MRHSDDRVALLFGDRRRLVQMLQLRDRARVVCGGDVEDERTKIRLQMRFFVDVRVEGALRLLDGRLVLAVREHAKHRAAHQHVARV